MSTGSRDAGSARTRNSEMSSSSSGSSEMTSQVQDAAEQAKQKAGEVADQAKQTTASRANEQKDKAADSLGSVARAFDDVGNQLRDQNPTMAHYADMASDKIEQFASQISNRDVTDLLGDVEDFARRNPAAFLGGAFALGMAAARFLKSSQPSGSSSDRAMMRYSGSENRFATGSRYPGHMDRAATPPRTNYHTAGNQQSTSPGYYSPDAPSTSTGQTGGRGAFGNTDPTMTTDTRRSDSGEDRYGTR